MSVKQYYQDFDIHDRLVEIKDGPWVQYSDYAALEDKLKVAREALKFYDELVENAPSPVSGWMAKKALEEIGEV